MRSSAFVIAALFCSVNAIRVTKAKPSDDIEMYTKIAQFFDDQLASTLKADDKGKISEKSQKEAVKKCASVDDWYDEAKDKLPFFDFDNKDQTS